MQIESSRAEIEANAPENSDYVRRLASAQEESSDPRLLGAPSAAGTIQKDKDDDQPSEKKTIPLLEISRIQDRVLKYADNVLKYPVLVSEKQPKVEDHQAEEAEGSRPPSEDEQPSRNKQSSRNEQSRRRFDRSQHLHEKELERLLARANLELEIEQRKMRLQIELDAEKGELHARELERLLARANLELETERRKRKLQFELEVEKEERRIRLNMEKEERETERMQFLNNGLGELHSGLHRSFEQLARLSQAIEETREAIGGNRTPFRFFS